MVGWHLLLLLGVEAATYGAIGWHAHIAWQCPLFAAVGVSVGIYLWVRMILVGAEFVLARGYGVTIPDEHRVAAPQLVAMYLRELAGWIMMFSIIQPFVVRRRFIAQRV